MNKNEIKLSNGMEMPRLGMGTWFLGEKKQKDAQETAALRAGIDAGIRLIDTAEMYGDGKSEQLIGRAIKGYDRSRLFLVSKVYPHNAGRRKIFKSVQQTLKNLQTDYLDLYLLHWRGAVPLEETVECMEQLMKEGKIRSWGVSNFDTDDMQEAEECDPDGNCCINQVLYNIGSRGIEWSLIPWQKKRNIPVMAYSPLYQTRLLKSKGLQKVAQELSITPAQLALAWLLHQGTIPIPKSSNIGRVEENRKAWDIELSQDVLDTLDRVFPPPTHKMPLDIL